MNKYILFIAVLFAAFQSFAQDLDPTGGGLCTGLSYEVVNADLLDFLIAYGATCEELAQ